jgi:hypothetical protein
MTTPHTGGPLLRSNQGGVLSRRSHLSLFGSPSYRNTVLDRAARLGNRLLRLFLGTALLSGGFFVFVGHSGSSRLLSCCPTGIVVNL